MVVFEYEVPESPLPLAPFAPPELSAVAVEAAAAPTIVVSADQATVHEV